MSGALPRLLVGGAALVMLLGGCSNGGASSNSQANAYLAAAAPVDRVLTTFQSDVADGAPDAQMSADAATLVGALTTANQKIAAIKFSGNAIADSRTVIADDEAFIGDIQALNDGSLDAAGAQFDRDIAQLNGAVVVLRADLGLPQLAVSATPSPVSYPSLGALAASYGRVDFEESHPTATPSGRVTAVAFTPTACDFTSHPFVRNCSPGKIVLAQRDRTSGAWRAVDEVPLPGMPGAVLPHSGSAVVGFDGSIVDSSWPVFVIPLTVSDTAGEAVVLGHVNSGWEPLRFDTDGNVTRVAPNGTLINGQITGSITSCKPSCAAGRVTFAYRWSKAKSEFVGSTAPQPTPTTAPPALLQALADDPAVGVPVSDLHVTVTYDHDDYTWARLDLSPASGAPDTGPATAIAHEAGSTWTVVDIGTDQVGCARSLHVPRVVLTDLGLVCGNGGGVY